jgi:hypothetical protein
MEMSRTRKLPPNLEPLAVSREEAADLWGIGTTTFDTLVREGKIDPPVRIGGRCLWDVEQLKQAWRRLASAGASNPWDEI